MGSGTVAISPASALTFSANDTLGVFSQGGQVDCSEFQDPNMFCTRESNPHCGSDGQTYGNRCAFCKAVVKSGGKISLKHYGKC
ncbi:serine protease inhibitor Kazal-type 6 isoform X1 [Manis javanica]|uniref:serine protease inhibitor Kazal-type 6 isoform X1 n=1 Tax=Manis javanica TaxID=9974 RepID=UPI003C6D3409